MEEDSRRQLIGQNKALAKKVEYLETVIETHHITKFEENVHRLKNASKTSSSTCTTMSRSCVGSHSRKNSERGIS